VTWEEGEKFKWGGGIECGVVDWRKGWGGIWGKCFGFGGIGCVCVRSVKRGKQRGL